MVGGEGLLDVAEFFLLDDAGPEQGHRGLLGIGILADQALPLFNGFGVVLLDFFCDSLIGSRMIRFEFFGQRELDLAKDEEDLTGASVKRVVLEELVEALAGGVVVLVFHRIESDLEFGIDDADLAL